MPPTTPDQRIADDTERFVEQTLALGIGLLSAVVTLVSFIFILWELSNEGPLHLFGRDLPIPGYLVWAALIYALIGTAFTHLIGRPLVALNFQQQRFEADFRFNLVRTRENSEQIALLHGEPVERTRLLGRFALVVDNWLGIMQRTKKLTAFTSSYSQASVIFPYVLIAPAYFAEKVQLGGMMQALSAFSSVEDSLSFFITAYRTLAEWQSVVARLSGFETAIENAEALVSKDNIIHVTADHDGTIDLEKLAISLPTGVPLVTADGFEIQPGERTLITGPSGSGKSTLFRAIAGIWPFGERIDFDSGTDTADDVAAAALLSGRFADGGRRLSRGSERFRTGATRRRAGRSRTAETGGAAGRGSPLEPAIVARRTTTSGTGPRAAAQTALSVPR